MLPGIWALSPLLSVFKYGGLSPSHWPPPEPVELVLLQVSCPCSDKSKSAKGLSLPGTISLLKVHIAPRRLLTCSSGRKWVPWPPQSTQGPRDSALKQRKEGKKPLLVHSLNHGFSRPLGEKELVKSGFKKAKTGEGFGYRSGLPLGGTGTLA